MYVCVSYQTSFLPWKAWRFKSIWLICNSIWDNTGICCSYSADLVAWPSTSISTAVLTSSSDFYYVYITTFWCVCTAPVCPYFSPGRSRAKTRWWMRCAGPPKGDRSTSPLSRHPSRDDHLWKDDMTASRHGHGDVIKWKHFSRQWSFVWGIQRLPVISPTKASDVELWRFLWSAPEQMVE